MHVSLMDTLRWADDGRTMHVSLMDTGRVGSMKCRTPVYRGALEKLHLRRSAQGNQTLNTGYGVRLPESRLLGWLHHGITRARRRCFLSAVVRAALPYRTFTYTRNAFFHFRIIIRGSAIAYRYCSPTVLVAAIRPYPGTVPYCTVEAWLLSSCLFFPASLASVHLPPSTV